MERGMFVVSQQHQVDVWLGRGDLCLERMRSDGQSREKPESRPHFLGAALLEGDKGLEF